MAKQKPKAASTPRTRRKAAGAPPKARSLRTASAGAKKRTSVAAGAVDLVTAKDIAPRGKVADKRRLQQLAMLWRSRLENREGWISQRAHESQLNQAAKEALAEWGFGDDALALVADAEVVEVRIPCVSDLSRDVGDNGWEMRVFPWEHVVTAATRDRRASGSMLVVRHLNLIDQRRPAAASPTTLAVVESAPGPLSEEFDFEQERKLVTSGSGLSELHVSNPTLSELTAVMKQSRPEVVHVSAIDTRLAIARSKRWPAAQARDMEAAVDSALWERDGVVLRGEGSVAVAPVEAIDVARALTAGKTPPRMICFNIWYSGSRIAALSVANGAGAALGIQTSFDDDLAESFFASFHRAYCASEWENPLAAFRIAWSSIAAHRHAIKGTGMVLWSAASLVQATAATQRKIKASQIKIDQARQAADKLLNIHDPNVRKKVEVEVRPLSRLNYSLLHNNRPLFDAFTIRKYVEGVLPDVRVEVRLYLGAESYPYIRSFDMQRAMQPLTTEVRLPLTSDLVRGVDENIRTNFLVRVTCQDVTLYENTHDVTLLPIDLWKDSDEDRQWLPSFVLPRDPAVTQIIQNAQELLACLADSMAQGFDGYQSFDAEAEDPAAGVDLQVRAIWTALIAKLPLSYINPPPSYEAQSQRLRTPSQVLQSGRGTCIDLAVMLAACLEFVEIHPVIFLLEGHAFPGYWRSEEAHDDLLTVSGASEKLQMEAAAPAAETRSEKSALPWTIPRDRYPEIMEHVKQGNLAPLESTLLASRAGFFEALETGLENLRFRREFHSMLDIRRAREVPVTPLPLGNSS